MSGHHIYEHHCLPYNGEDVNQDDIPLMKEQR